MVTAKDFIETVEGLIFAVVDQALEDGKVLCFLRYAQTDLGWRKQSTNDANELLAQFFPEFLHYSPIKDAQLHAVPVARVYKIHKPGDRLQALLQSGHTDPIEYDLLQLCLLYQKYGLDLAQVGVTGSLLVGTHNSKSDIDLVIYNRDQFHLARKLTGELIQSRQLYHLDEEAWQQSYLRRDCYLSEQEYIWHEQRKLNKAIINNRKFDLNFVDKASVASEAFFKKGSVYIETTVKNDYHAFDYPAVFDIEHPVIKQVVCFTATYIGQALKGEKIAVSGFLEESVGGGERIVVGSSREAKGEFIQVIRE